MTVTALPGVRLKSKIQRKLAHRKSLVKCGKCCHTARTHFKLRFHVAKYHRSNTRNSGKFCMLSRFGRSMKNHQVGRTVGLSRDREKPMNSSPIKVERVVELKDDNLETSTTVRNEGTEKGSEKAKIGRPRKVYTRKSVTVDPPVMSSTRQLRSSRNSADRCGPLAKAKELKSRRESLQSINERLKSKSENTKLKKKNWKSKSENTKSKGENKKSKGKNTKLKGDNTKSKGDNMKSKGESKKLENENLKPKRSSKKMKKREHRGLIPVPCHLCDYVGRDSYNLRRHMQSKHEPKPPKVPKVHRCELCEYKNRYRFLVKRHSTIHFREGGRRGEKSVGFPCDKCEYVSASACNLKRHQVSRHEKVKEAKLQCSLCDHREPDRPALFGHFHEAHGVIIETERLEFDDFQSFMEFKMDMEKSTFARFVRQQTRMGQKKHVIFKCHRDGMFKSKSRGERKRALKTTGSNKINSACPASMRMTIDTNGKVSVVFTKTHVGHSNEVCRLTLTKEEKILVGEMLESRRTFQEILSEIRNGMDSERLERIHLLSRKDLQNIEKWYKNREVEEPPRLPIDINIEAWVAKVQDTGVVRLYKKPATILPKPFKCLEYDDFVLVVANDLQLAMLRQYGNECICIDNAYENSHVRLTSLMVVDDSRQGFPCAFMLSSKIDRIIMKVFLEVIKKESKCPMTPSILVVDIPDYRRTEWSAVMDLPESAEVLYSPWSIDADLNRNLLKVKKETERTEVCNNIKKLISEKNTSEFPKSLEKTVKFLEQNPNTELFGKYFKSKFADTSHRWALGFRNRLHAECTDGLESVHDIVKFVYSEGQKNDKLEDCIGVLMTCSRDQLQDRIALYERIWPEGSAYSVDGIQKLVNSIANRHEAADDMKTQTAGSGVYEIMESNLQCRCELRCSKCDVCIHTFRCTCDDSILGWTVCRHIHFCVMNNSAEQETSASLHLTGSNFDPLEEKRKLLLEFENMCDDIAADEEAVGDTIVVEVPVIKELPREDGELNESMDNHEESPQDGGELKEVMDHQEFPQDGGELKDVMDRHDDSPQDGGELKEVMDHQEFPQGGGELKEVMGNQELPRGGGELKEVHEHQEQGHKLEELPQPPSSREQLPQPPSPRKQLPQLPSPQELLYHSPSPLTSQLQQKGEEQKHQQPSPQQPQRLEDAKSKLQWRFQSICQQMSSDVDLTLIEQALVSIESAISSRQTRTE